MSTLLQQAQQETNKRIAWLTHLFKDGYTVVPKDAASTIASGPSATSIAAIESATPVTSGTAGGEDSGSDSDSDCDCSGGPLFFASGSSVSTSP